MGEETEKASEAKSDVTNGMTSKALVEDLNVLTGWYRQLLKFEDDTKIVSKVGMAEHVKPICINCFSSFKIVRCC